MKIDDLISESIETMREHAPPEGYFGCFSGGKDSVLLYHLASIAGVQVAWHYHNTTIDPPELIYFIREHYPDVIWDRPRRGPLFHRIVEKRLMPTRRFRWCCDEYKEISGPRGSVMLLGIRGEESPSRASSWGLHVWHKRKRRWTVNPIFNWATDELWEFLSGSGVKTCELYREGFTRLGCVGCPLAGSKTRLLEFDRWPSYGKAWKWAARRLWETAAGTNNTNGTPWRPSCVFRNFHEYWDWWIGGKPWPQRVLPGCGL